MVDGGKRSVLFLRSRSTRRHRCRIVSRAAHHASCDSRNVMRALLAVGRGRTFSAFKNTLAHGGDNELRCFERRCPITRRPKQRSSLSPPCASVLLGIAALAAGAGP